MQIQSRSPLQIPDVNPGPSAELRGPKIRTGEEMEELKNAFNFQNFVFVMSQQPMSSSSSDTASDRANMQIDAKNEQEEVLSQPKSIIKPAFIN